MFYSEDSEDFQEAIMDVTGAGTGVFGVSERLRGIQEGLWRVLRGVSEIERKI